MPIGKEAASFVARIWLERHQNGDPVWRGNIRHVQSGESQHFTRLAAMRLSRHADPFLNEGDRDRIVEGACAACPGLAGAGPVEESALLAGLGNPPGGTAGGAYP